jgi:hypothetical protein
MEDISPTFTVPTALSDLEDEPYNLLPYPNDFDEDADDMSRAAAFDDLVSSNHHDKILKLFGIQQTYHTNIRLLCVICDTYICVYIKLIENEPK